MNETFWNSELSYSGIQSYRSADMKNQSTESIEFYLINNTLAFTLSITSKYSRLRPKRIHNHLYLITIILSLKIRISPYVSLIAVMTSHIVVCMSAGKNSPL